MNRNPFSTVSDFVKALSGSSRIPVANSLSWLHDSSSRYFGVFDANFVRNRLCRMTGSTLNDAINDNKLFIGGIYKIEIVFG